VFHEISSITKFKGILKRLLFDIELQSSYPAYRNSSSSGYIYNFQISPMFT